ncbi:hypothetical protein FIU87_12800 [Bacillus sp. THAF10]|uniref:DUF6366 family protein n=1 Tax=Bacillus sp. THAF10 TaxID=2587848 RepID=UPI0012692E5E|nr:DUF6366 family protein [Bacillus sp. THAF10]QFT89531.1 hypothetical protein FIU87_12800 [Bacillus sp. THAF10]
MTDKEKPYQMRERLKQEESKRNPGGAFNDGVTRSIIGSVSDMSLKTLGITILILLGIILIFIIF